MMNMPDISFSVVIPLYNKVHFIEKTVRSVLQQTYCNYEIIIVDDGSTDGGDAVVLELAKQYPQIHVWRQVNQGVSAARNKGKELAKNTYIAFLDADDIWDVNVLESYVFLIEKFPEYSVFAVAQKGCKQNDVIQREQIMVVEDYCKYNSIFQTSGLCFKANILKEIGGFKVGVQIGEDRDYWLRVSCKYSFVFFYREIITKPAITENNLMSLILNKIDKEKIYPYWDWYDYKSIYKQDIDKYASIMILWQSFYFYNSGQYEDAVFFLARMKKGHCLIKKCYLRFMIFIKEHMKTL